MDRVYKYPNLRCIGCTLEGKTRALFNNARSRAKKHMLEFTLTNYWLFKKLEAGVCEYSGVPFYFNGTYANRSRSPSIERINPRIGYTEENCRVVLWSLNKFKGKATFEETLYIARKFVEHNS